MVAPRQKPSRPIGAGKADWPSRLMARVRAGGGRCPLAVSENDIQTRPIGAGKADWPSRLMARARAGGGSCPLAVSEKAKC